MHDDNCPNCGSSNTYYSKKKQLCVCEDCGHEFAVKAQNAGLRLFFSYGHDTNEPIVMRIKSDLEARGHTVWIDKNQIKSGENWRRSITDGITDSSKVLAFLSRHSTRDPGVCLDELRIALCVKGCDIKTVLLENEKSVCPPSAVSDIQWMDMSVWSEKEAEGIDTFEAWYKEKLDELCQVVESPESRSFQGEIEQLRRILQPVILDEKEQILLRKPYMGRTWLNEALEDWRQNKKNAKAFLLFGTPGTGKSAFCVNELFNNPNAVCGFLCQWDKPGVSSEKNIMRTLAFKLASKLPDYRKVLLATLTQVLGDSQEKNENKKKMGLDDYSPSELFSLLIVNPLNNCINGGRERQFIILDGLDEAGGASTLAQSLANNLLNLPDWIGFVITSRPEPEIADVFRNFEPLAIDVSTQENQSDIYSYFKQTLSDLLKNAEDRHGILNRATKSSEGSFLYAELFTDEVLAGRLDLRNPADYPKGLTSFYRQNFDRKFSDYNTYKNIRCFLELMLSDEGLPIEIIMDVTGCDRYAYREFRDLLGSLLVERVPGEFKHLTFCHKSLADWLKNETASGKYFIDIQIGNNKLASYAQEIIHSAKKTNLNDNAVYYLKKHIASYFHHAKMWHEYEAFLLALERVPPLEPYWNEVDYFPEDWDMTTLFAKLNLREIAEAPARSISNATYRGLDGWETVYAFFSKAIQTPRLADAFFDGFWEPIGRFFESGASDEFSGYDKTMVAYHLHLIMKRCETLGITIPNDVKQAIEHTKLSCFFDMGKANESFLSYEFNNRPYIFRDNICLLENPGKLQGLKSLFNTYCFCYEMKHDSNIAKLRKLVSEGVTKDSISAIMSPFKGSEGYSYIKEGEMLAARQELNEIFNDISYIKRWHPQPAKFIGQLGIHYGYMDRYKFLCCGREIIYDGAGDPSQFRDDGCEIYEDDEKTKISESAVASETDCNHEYEYQDVVKSEPTTETLERKDMPSYEIYVRYGSWTKVCKKCGYAIKQTGRIREGHFTMNDVLYEADSN